jgi:diguanylate cyclase (GGDEF)-like protein
MVDDKTARTGGFGTEPRARSGATTRVEASVIRSANVYGEDNEPVLTVVAGAQVGQTIALNGKTLDVGREADCEIKLVGSGISRHHFRLERRRDETFSISDLDSTNGIFVNGCQTKRHVLADGDLISLGPETVLKFSIENTIDIRNRMRQYEESIRDVLTGLYNRRYFESRFRHELAYALRHGDPLSVILIDADAFKRVNDEHGHPVGDSVIKLLADRLTEQLRTEDVLVRYGGEEFALIVRDQDAAAVNNTAERVRRFVEASDFSVGDKHMSITISLGTSTLRPEGPATPEELVAEADRNLYEAKARGRNRTVGI